MAECELGANTFAASNSYFKTRRKCAIAASAATTCGIRRRRRRCRRRGLMMAFPLPRAWSLARYSHCGYKWNKSEFSVFEEEKNAPRREIEKEQQQRTPPGGNGKENACAVYVRERRGKAYMAWSGWERGGVGVSGRMDMSFDTFERSHSRMFPSSSHPPAPRMRVLCCLPECGSLAAERRVSPHHHHHHHHYRVIIILHQFRRRV